MQIVNHWKKNVLLIAIIDDRADRETRRRRPNDRPRLEIRRERPIDGGRQPGVPGVGPVSVPARLDLLAQRKMKRLARDDASRFGDETDRNVTNTLRLSGGGIAEACHPNRRRRKTRPFPHHRLIAMVRAHVTTTPARRSSGPTQNAQRLRATRRGAAMPDPQLPFPSSSSLAMTAVTGGRTLKLSSYSLALITPSVPIMKMIGRGTP